MGENCLRVWQGCGKFFSFGFMDDVIFEKKRDEKNRILPVTQPGGGGQ